MKALKLLASCTIGAIFCSDYAAAKTSEELLQECKTASRVFFASEAPDDWSELLRGSECISYITGARHMNTLYQLRLRGTPGVTPFFCIPEEASNRQLARVVANHLEKNPQKLHEHAMGGILGSFKEAFPCSSGNANN